jgi:hypothetical protein
MDLQYLGACMIRSTETYLSEFTRGDAFKFSCTRDAQDNFIFVSNTLRVRFVCYARVQRK